MNDYDGKCTYLLEKCRKCERLFRRDERYLDCPDCGEPRKCERWAVKPYKLCDRHGGKANLKAKYVPRGGRGIVTGSGSKSQIAKLAYNFIQESKSGALQTNKAGLRIVDDRIAALLERIEENDDPDRIKNIIKAWNDLNTAIPGIKQWSSQNREAQKAYNLMEAMTKAAFHDYKSWDQVFNALNLRRQMVEGEVKIYKDLKSLMTAEDGEQLVAMLLAAVIKVLGDVPDGAKYIKAIHAEFARITGESDIDGFGNGSGEIIEVEAIDVGRG